VLDHEKQGLVLKIEKAFRTAPFPGRKIGIYGYTSEVSDFIGKTWQEIRLNDVNWDDPLYFFTLEAFHYYLPAYLISIINEPENVNPVIIDKLIEKLSFGDWTKKKFCKLFTKQQKAVIRDFLNHVEELLPKHHQELVHLEVQKAIEFWADC
jgi:uncharacterized protein DUF6714